MNNLSGFLKFLIQPFSGSVPHYLVKCNFIFECLNFLWAPSIKSECVRWLHCQSRMLHRKGWMFKLWRRLHWHCHWLLIQIRLNWQSLMIELMTYRRSWWVRLHQNTWEVWRLIANKVWLKNWSAPKIKWFVVVWFVVVLVVVLLCQVTLQFQVIVASVIFTKTLRISICCFNSTQILHSLLLRILPNFSRSQVHFASDQDALSIHLEVLTFPIHRLDLPTRLGPRPHAHLHHYRYLPAFVSFVRLISLSVNEYNRMRKAHWRQYIITNM